MLTIKTDTKKIKLADTKVWLGRVKKLVKLIINNIISGKIAKEVFDEMFNKSKDPEDIVKNKNLSQLTDTKAIERIIESILKNNLDKVNDYNNGKTKLLGFFIGQAMKESKGKANPKILNEVLSFVMFIFLNINNFSSLTLSKISEIYLWVR